MVSLPVALSHHVVFVRKNVFVLSYASLENDSYSSGVRHVTKSSLIRKMRSAPPSVLSNAALTNSSLSHCLMAEPLHDACRSPSHIRVDAFPGDPGIVCEKMRRLASDCCKPPHHRSRHSLSRSIRSSSPRLQPSRHAFSSTVTASRPLIWAQPVNPGRMSLAP